MKRKTTTYSIQGKASFQRNISGGACFACVVVRRFLLFLLLSALLTPLSTLFSACGHDDIVPPDVYVEEPSTPYVELRIVIPVANTNTRSNPMGGEDGNGREEGLEKEDLVHDVNIFFFRDDDGLDGKDTTSVIHHIFFNIDLETDEDNTPLLKGTKPEREKNYLKLKFDLSGELEKLGVGTRFAAIANIGSIQSEKITNLGDLRDLNVSDYADNTWSKRYDEFSVNAGKMDYFLMSTAYNTGNSNLGSNKIEKNGNNFIGVTTLERLYSRIDLWYNAKENAGIDKDTESGADKVDQLEYSVGETGNKVYVYNVLPVNVMKQPSYLFKKVTSSKPDSWKVDDLSKVSSFLWGGKEQISDNGVPSNYVIERKTFVKKSDGTGDCSEWYKGTDINTVRDAIADEHKGKFKSYYSRKREAAGNDPTNYNCDRISIISYANENTHAIDCFHPNYLTGLAFRAIYVPKKIYKTSDASDEETVSIGDEISKVYRYSKSAKHDDGNPNNQLEADCIYFSKYEDAKTYSDNHPADLGVITTYDAYKHTLEDDSEEWGFICYYNLWLRHYNDFDDTNTDPHPHFPMEYATVRNNIYRVAISFSGPGDPTPTMREPDTMKARIFVRKWNYREEPDIIF